MIKGWFKKTDRSHYYEKRYLELKVSKNASVARREGISIIYSWNVFDISYCYYETKIYRI